MQKLGLPQSTPEVYKKNRVFRESNGYFMHVKCENCEELTLCYSHSQTDIKCKGCSEMVLKSTGGMAKLVNKAKTRKAENSY